MENGQDLLHAIRLPSLYIMSHIFCSSFTSPLPLSSPGAASVHLLISFCAGKPPVQGRQEDQEMASGTQIRHKKKKKQTQICRTRMPVILILLCFSLCRVLCMQMFINITKHRHCAGWSRLLYKSLPKLYFPSLKPSPFPFKVNKYFGILLKMDSLTVAVIFVN